MTLFIVLGKSAQNIGVVRGVIMVSFIGANNGG